MDFVYFLFSSRLHQELMGFRFVCFSVWLCRSPWGPAQVFLFANQLICKSLRVFFKLGNKCYGFCNTPTEKPPQRADIEPRTPPSSGMGLDSKQYKYSIINLKGTANFVKKQICRNKNSTK